MIGNRMLTSGANSEGGRVRCPWCDGCARGTTMLNEESHGGEPMEALGDLFNNGML
jgi:uncharacterized protein YodC (DUF2158 family)